MNFSMGISTDPENVVGKVFTKSLEVNLRLRGAIDWINPVLRLRGLEFERDYNYASMVADRERFYFVRDVKPISGDLFEVSLELDVLETYKAEVISSEARFHRNLQNGDFVSTGFDMATTKTIVAHESDGGLTAGSTMLLTTVGS